MKLYFSLFPPLDVLLARLGLARLRDLQEERAAAEQERVHSFFLTQTLRRANVYMDALEAANGKLAREVAVMTLTGRPWVPVQIDRRLAEAVGAERAEEARTFGSTTPCVAYTRS